MIRYAQAFRLNRIRSARVHVAFLAVTLALCSQASALQGALRIEGVVKDQAGAPVSSAEVVLTTKTGGSRQITDSEGRFAFPSVQGESGTITVRATGFDSAERRWSAADKASTSLDVVLIPAPLASEMTVTAERTATRVSDTAASIVVVSAEELATTAALTVDDALRQVPGFSLLRRSGSRTANPTSQGVSFRGVGPSGASRAVVLSDGIPINDPFGGWVYWGRVPREAINRIEVVQGGASSLYGTDALGGVINLITRDPRNAALSYEASYGNQKTPDGSFFAAGSLFQWAAALSLEAFHTDGYVLVDEAERGRVDTKAGAEHTTLDLTVERLISDKGRIFVRGSIFDESRENGTPLQTNNTYIRQVSFGTDLHSTLAGSFNIRAFALTEIYNQDFSSIAADRNSEALTRSQRVPAQQVGFTTQWSRAAGSFQTLVAGLDYREVRGASDELGFTAGKLTLGAGAGGRERTIGVFAEDIIRVTPRWLLTLGARGDHWSNYDALSTSRPLPAQTPVTVTKFPDRTENAFSPRVALMHKLTENVSVVVSGYRAFRAPTLNELYRSFRVGNVLTQANVNLRAERLTGGEAGISAAAFDKKLNIRGTFFWSEIVRPVANVTLSATPALITRQRQNLGRTRSRGVEFEAEARVTGTLSLSAGYQFLDATVLKFPANTALEGLLIPQVPRHLFTFQARYSNPHLLTFAVQGRAGSTQFDDDQNLFPLDPYFTLDALASRSLGRGVEVFGALENLTGERYDIGRTPVRTIGPPLLARIGVRFALGKR
ncbi:MAG TPA: TonB-dependent receptor [Blastocatellia bacterium]|nr:TonB-dependent receptor [Blastocatellia bacterium]